MGFAADIRPRLLSLLGGAVKKQKTPAICRGFVICMALAFSAHSVGRTAEKCQNTAKMGGLLAAQQIYHSRYGFANAISIKNCSYFSAMCARNAPDVLTLCGIEVQRKGWYIIAKERVIPMDKVINL